MAERNAIYKGKTWREVREATLELDKHKCQRCLGKYDPDPNRPKRLTEAVLVHHHFPAKQYPQWKYSIYVNQNGKKVRNLYSLCFECHEIVEGRRSDRYQFTKDAEETDFTNEERWD